MECTTKQFSDDGLEVRGSNPAQSPLTASLDILLWLGIFLPHLRGKELIEVGYPSLV